MNKIIYAKFIDDLKIEFSVNNSIKSYTIYSDSKIIETNSGTKDKSLYLISLDKDIFDARNTYSVEVLFLDDRIDKIDIDLLSLYKTSFFNNKYVYDGFDLGATYNKKYTTFKVYSPLSKEIILKVYSNGTPKNIDELKGSDIPLFIVPMDYNDNGIFSATIHENLEGMYYTYTVTNSKYQNIEVVDPYAKSAGINGLRGMIVDFSKTNPKGWENVDIIPYSKNEMVVYETHISDITSSSSWSNDSNNLVYKHTFKGATIPNTTYTQDGITVKTGFDHIKELGINTLQILPFFDHDNDETNMIFNWGYNPLNYNCLEGGYSTNPYDGYVRIKEFKELVMKYHNENINIIMDVVYNHVSDALKSNFEILVPGYYFRHDSLGNLSNGSGCGNETASEMPMFRKFMIDSLEFLAKEYKLFGFRFDLMAVHDYETMNLIVKNLKEKVNPNIVVYGEPWVGGESSLDPKLSASQANGNKYIGYGQFNDQYRDALIMGGMKAKEELGWVNNTNKTIDKEMDKIKNGILGYTTGGASDILDNDKTVTYVTCHDNYTLYDRMKAAGINDDEVIKKMAILANSMVLTSKGISFILAGEEFLRTKHGEDNSYNLSYKINELDYSLKVKNNDMFEIYKKLIYFKKNILKNNDIYDINISENNNQISYKLKNENIEYLIIHNNSYNVDKLLNLDISSYKIYLNTSNNNNTNNPWQTLILYK